MEIKRLGEQCSITPKSSELPEGGKFIVNICYGEAMAIKYAKILFGIPLTQEELQGLREECRSMREKMETFEVFIDALNKTFPGGIDEDICAQCSWRK